MPLLVHVKISDVDPGTAKRERVEVCTFSAENAAGPN